MTNLKLITTENFGDLSCNFYRNMNDDVLLTREQIGMALEYANPDVALSKIHKRHKDRLDSLCVRIKLEAKDGKEYNTYLYTIEGCLLICSLSHSNNKLEFSEFLLKVAKENKNFVILSTRQKIDFIDDLEDALKHFNLTGIKQYNILSYRVDYYIPELKIAIEYDENEHKYYTYEQHENRQKQIEKELNCKFIRVSNKFSNGYNIGLILKFLFAHVNT